MKATVRGCRAVLQVQAWQSALVPQKFGFISSSIRLQGKDPHRLAGHRASLEELSIAQYRRD